MVNKSQNMLEGREGTEHIPQLPFWMVCLRGFQLLVAIIVLGLSAYAGSGVGFLFVGYSMSIFTFVWTIIFLGYILVSSFFIPKIYNMWAQLVLEIFCVIWWLSAFASLAALAAVWSVGQDYVNSTCTVYGYSCSKMMIKRASYGVSQFNSQANATKAAAALGAFEWISFVVTLIVFSISVHRARMATRNQAPPVFQEQEHKMETLPKPQPVEYVQPVDPRYQQQTMA